MIDYYIISCVGASVLIVMGIVGVVLSRNVVRMLLATELIYNGALVMLLALASRKPVESSALGLIVVILGSAEAAVLVAIIAAYYRCRRSLELPEERGGV